MTQLRSVSLIGAPTDIGAGARGASMGPEALRVAGLQAALEGRGLQVADRGNLAGPANPWLPPVDGYRHLPQVVEWNRAVFDAVRDELVIVSGDRLAIPHEARRLARVVASAFDTFHQQSPARHSRAV